MTEHATPTAEANLLDGLDEAMPLGVDHEIDELSGRPKQQYDHVARDPDELVETEAPAGPAEGEGTRMGAMARKKAAQALMLIFDRAQAGIFTLFGAKGHAEDFRFNATDRNEMAGYLEQGLPEDFQMPWYVPFGLLLVTQLAANYMKLQEIREEKERQAEAERAKMRVAKEAEEQAAKDEALLRRREERTDRREQRAEERQEARRTNEADLCPECNTNELKPGRMYCSTSCRSKANGRKRKAA